MTRAYTVEVQTASVFFYAESYPLDFLSLMAVKHGHTR